MYIYIYIYIYFTLMIFVSIRQMFENIFDISLHQY